MNSWRQAPHGRPSIDPGADLGSAVGTTASTSGRFGAWRPERSNQARYRRKGGNHDDLNSVGMHLEAWEE